MEGLIVVTVFSMILCIMAPVSVWLIACAVETFSDAYRTRAYARYTDAVTARLGVDHASKV